MTDLSPDEKKTLAAYESGGQGWSNQRMAFDLYQQELVDYSKIVPSGRILDIGSGNGRDALLLTEAGYKVDGLDISKTLLSVAKQECPEASFTLGSMYELPFEDQSFDGTWMVASLLHIPREKAALPIQEARRVVKDQGGLFLTVKAGEGEALVAQGGMDDRLFVYWQEDPLVELVEAHGWKVEKVARRVIGESWILVWARAV